MADYQKYINALRKCAKEHENDTTFKGQSVFDLCRDTANLLEELEQEPRKGQGISHDENDNLVKISTLSPGTTFEVDNIQMEILEHRTKSNEIGVFCLAKDILFKKIFDEDNNNNWWNSSLRNYLDYEYKETLSEDFREALLPFERDLITDDGMKDYGTCVDTISLISCDEYRKYRKYISDKSDWWWTLTAWSAKPNNSFITRFVDTDGCLYDSGVSRGNIGVSPAFLLKPDFKVKKNCS